MATLSNIRITNLLKKGNNNIEVFLGNGWYKGRYGLNRRQLFQYGDKFALICEMHVEYDDGSTEIIMSDTNWKARRSKVVDSNIFDGEIFDDTFSDDNVYNVKLIDIDTKKLEPRRSPATKIKERINAVEIIHTPAGETVIDMGQNMVGWLEFTNRAPKGTELCSSLVKYYKTETSTETICAQLNASTDIYRMEK